MPESHTPSEDPYARSEYRRLIAWDARIRRERGFLSHLLERAPERSVLDLGCGTGEHVAFFARSGARAVGVDRSEEMLEHAKDHERKGEGRFVLGDAIHARQALGEERFGLIICLGNMLPHLIREQDMDDLLLEAHSLLLPGGILLVQILNYRRILEGGVRHLPLNFREGDDPGEGESNVEVVFLRLLKAESPERILFFPTTLVLDPESDEPVRVTRTRRVELRPWIAGQLLPKLAKLGFETRLNGDMEGGEHRELESSDLVLVATRR